MASVPFMHGAEEWKSLRVSSAQIFDCAWQNSLGSPLKAKGFCTGGRVQGQHTPIREQTLGEADRSLTVEPFAKFDPPVERSTMELCSRSLFALIGEGI